MKRLVLVYPNQRWQPKRDTNTTWDLNPATLCLLATVVKDLVEIKVIDAQFYDISQSDFKKQIESFMPDFVGISLMTSEYQDTLDIAAAIIKTVNAHVITIAGGVHVTTKYDYVMQNTNIDYAVRGEGEETFRALIQHLTGAAPFPERGVVFRDDGRVHAQNAALVEDLSRIPSPDYSYINLSDYLSKGGRFGPNRPPEYPSYRIVTTRGCPFGCSFCQVELISGKHVRSRSPEAIVEELMKMKQDYGIQSVLFEDDNMLMAEGGKFAKRLFSLMIKKNLGLKWSAIAFAIFLLTDELLDLMQKSGCVGINIAVESGNRRVLSEIVQKKALNLDKVPDQIAKIKSKNMYCIANFIIGFPGETWDEIRETIAFAENCGADYVKIFVAVPLFGTKLYKTALGMGAIKVDENYPKTNWRYSQVNSNEWTSKDISILRAYEWDRINFAPHRIQKVSQIWGMSVDELSKVRKQTRDQLSF
jgi:anaerobic magnesium-protoporphyrin IX monomethyl ester cyclase